MTTPVRKEARAKAFADRLSALPVKPGVYLMKDAAGTVIYVGKAASLRNRIRSYFQTPYGKEPKVQAMVQRIADFEFIVTETVQEALLLENLLIKRRKPFYNARLKDDKTYPYIKIDLSEEFPQVYFTRRVLADGARYFGPFASASSVRKTMDLLKKLFPYRSCTKPITGVDERPCLEYHIHRCVAPCIGAVDRNEYGQVIREVLQFLEGDSEAVEASIRRKMQEASESLEFERAAVLRDQIRAIESVTQNQKVVSNRREDSDVIALAYDKGEAWVELFKVRHGKLIDRDHFLMEGGEAEDEALLLEHFVQQYYEASTDVPGSVLLQHDLENAAAIAEWLTGRRGRRVAVARPQRGPRRRLVEMAAGNAREALTQRRIKWLNESDKVLQALVELQEALTLPALPERIECYDISNTQGAYSVGSMVVFENGRPRNGHYRRFQIKSVDGVDDYASMQEMLRRRFRRLGEARREAAALAAHPSPPDAHPAPASAHPSPSMVRGEPLEPRTGEAGAPPLDANPAANAQPTPPMVRGEPVEPQTNIERRGPQESFGFVPGLVIIDGGKGHLGAAQEVFLELGVTDIPLCSLAKREEEVFLPHMPEPVILPRQSQGLYLVQRVRDEAHRFAITYHRQRRSKAATASRLDQAPGIGPKRRRELIRRFGSVAGIRAAAAADIAQAPGMSLASAERLKAFLGGEE